MENHLTVYFLRMCFFILCTKGEHFDYHIPNNWKSEFPECGGRRQSPIALNSSEVMHKNLPPLTFINYDIPVSGHVKAINNGHTIQIDIPKTNDGRYPCLHGGGINFMYQVKGFHFHWGSAGVPGSEHSINGKQYDLELHIVHKKIPYHTLEEARSDPYGILVLTVLFQGAQDGSVGATNLDSFFDALPRLTEFESHVELELMTMGQFLGNLNTEEYYMYYGSLTTPPCPEAAVWFVFPDVLPIEHRNLEKFWNLHDSKSELLLHNGRPIQATNFRTIYYRKGHDKLDHRKSQIKSNSVF